MTGEIYIVGQPTFLDPDLTFQVHLDGLTPPVDRVWTEARIEESSSLTGPWQEVETVVLEGSAPYSLTTQVGTFQAGAFRAVFLDGAGHEWTTELFQHRESVWHDIRPPASDLATLLRARTVDRFSNEGSFTATTRPTLAQVNSTIDQAVDHTFLSLGSMEIPARYRTQARALVSLRAAVLIEAGYFPEQANQDQSAQNLYAAMFLSQLEGLKTLMNENGPGEKHPGFGSLVTRGLSSYRGTLDCDYSGSCIECGNSGTCLWNRVG